MIQAKEENSKKETNDITNYYFSSIRKKKVFQENLGRDPTCKTKPTLHKVKVVRPITLFWNWKERSLGTLTFGVPHMITTPPWSKNSSGLLNITH